MTLAILFSLKSMETLENGLQTLGANGPLKRIHWVLLTANTLGPAYNENLGPAYNEYTGSYLQRIHWVLLTANTLGPAYNENLGLAYNECTGCRLQRVHWVPLTASKNARYKGPFTPNISVNAATTL